MPKPIATTQRATQAAPAVGRRFDARTRSRGRAPARDSHEPARAQDLGLMPTNEAWERRAR
eukprot:8845386-Alexandrium_andersonii.AAC.1